MIKDFLLNRNEELSLLLIKIRWCIFNEEPLIQSEHLIIKTMNNLIETLNLFVESIKEQLKLFT